jgi:hypothetical protein
MKLPQLSLRELFAILTCVAISLAMVVAPPSLLLFQLASGLKVALILFFAAVIAGGGWNRPFAIGCLVTLLLFFYFPERWNQTSYFTELLLQCSPQPSFYGASQYGNWTRIIDTVLGIDVGIVGGFIAREVRKRIEHRRQS